MSFPEAVPGRATANVCQIGPALGDVSLAKVTDFGAPFRRRRRALYICQRRLEYNLQSAAAEAQSLKAGRRGEHTPVDFRSFPVIFDKR
ncbi:hypothetical protein EVAR_45710_1 [Eumeta japonica]|uniref:Uncharacterized protein n=1 Tax=Eumeta variegata TaxID=151549 RepID=A0A4C1WVD1_EUMVA|nr:hypothetical protein EVAR_45710_1 [Eumeta japonica]